MEYNLKENNYLKGMVGEKIVEHHLKQMGFMVFRPPRLLGILNRLGCPGNFEVEFLKKYRKTMDFFAILPEEIPFLDRRQVVLSLFASGGLEKFMGQSRLGSGYVVEVKSSRNGKNSLSRRQKKMFDNAKEAGFNVIQPKVVLKDDFNVQVIIEK